MGRGRRVGNAQGTMQKVGGERVKSEKIVWGQQQQKKNKKKKQLRMVGGGEK